MIVTMAPLFFKGPLFSWNVDPEINYVLKRDVKPNVARCNVSLPVSSLSWWNLKGKHLKMLPIAFTRLLFKKNAVIFIHLSFTICTMMCFFPSSPCSGFPSFFTHKEQCVLFFSHAFAFFSPPFFVYVTLLLISLSLSLPSSVFLARVWSQ